MDEVKGTVKKIAIIIGSALLIWIVALCVIWFGVLRPYYQPPKALRAEYTYDQETNHMIDPQFYEELKTNDAYALGINKEGKVVFKNPKKAWKAAKKQWKSGRKFLQEEYHLKHCSKTYYLAYIQRAKEVGSSGGTDTQKAASRSWGEFLDIYKNSFYEKK